MCFANYATALIQDKKQHKRIFPTVVGKITT